MCEFVGSIADDPMTKNIQNSTGCNAMIVRGSVTGQSTPVISNVDNIRRRLQRATKETGLLNSQDIDRVVEDSLDEEGEEMVVDRKEASVSKVIRTKWVVTNKETPEKPNVWARWVA